MFTFKILNIEPERMNIMIYRILDLEKKSQNKIDKQGKNCQSN